MEENTKEKKYAEKIKNLEAELSASNLEIIGLKNENKELQDTIKEKDAQIDFLSNEINEVKSQKAVKPQTKSLASQTEVLGDCAVLLTKISGDQPDNNSQAGYSGSILSQVGFIFQDLIRIRYRTSVNILTVQFHFVLIL